MPRMHPVVSLPTLTLALLGLACDPDPGEVQEEDEVIDADGDGVIAEEDCDDSLSWVYPGAAETCDGIDNDCDGDIDEELSRTFYIDGDGDGYGDESNSVESCEAPSGAVSDATDCDDGNADIYPGATEACDDIDNDCDGNIDEDVIGTFYTDSDGDGYGDPATADSVCEAGKAQVENSSDCDDTSADTHPAAAEICDSIDNDCDGLVDDEDAIDDPTAPTWFADADDDNSGNPDIFRVACEEPEGFTDNDQDCDDTDRMIKPDGLEVCDDIDNDCDALIDADDDSLDLGTALEAFPDIDRDGYGDDSRAEWVCEFSPRLVYTGGDCDDRDDTVHEDATEVCDDTDNDCDGDVDEEDVCDGSETAEWTSFSGFETFEYAEGGAYGDRNCELFWFTSGTTSSSSYCTDCVFVFDVEAVYRRAISTDDGSCVTLSADQSYTYGYVEDYLGYGPYLMYYVSGYGTFASFAAASFDDSTGELDYQYGYEDLDYYKTGSYYTQIFVGEAELTAE